MFHTTTTAATAPEPESLGCFQIPLNLTLPGSRLTTPANCITRCPMLPYALIAPTTKDTAQFWCICVSQVPQALPKEKCDAFCLDGLPCGGRVRGRGRGKRVSWWWSGYSTGLDRDGGIAAAAKYPPIVKSLNSYAAVGTNDAELRVARVADSQETTVLETITTTLKTAASTTKITLATTTPTTATTTTPTFIEFYQPPPEYRNYTPASNTTLEIKDLSANSPPTAVISGAVLGTLLLLVAGILAFRRYSKKRKELEQRESYESQESMRIKRSISIHEGWEYRDRVLFD
ncbi:hypothetical protein BDR26DRAFT_894948 [Obelidium mucronatum]|nr:hypothetical protein BDR26DRAFT_894948 [Obelidium mucronatum]